MKCLIIEDNILEILDEIEEQMKKDIICCKCKEPCNKNSKCSMAMKNLLTDIGIFKQAYSEINEKEKSEMSDVIKQVLND